MTLPDTIIIGVVSSLIGLICGGFLAPKPLIKEYRNAWIIGLILLLSFLVLCASALYLEGSWGKISSIVAALLVALFSILLNNSMLQKKENERKAIEIVNKRIVELTIIQNKLLAAHGMVSQILFRTEECMLTDPVCTMNQLEETDLQNDIIKAKFYNLFGWPRIELNHTIDRDLDNVPFPITHGEFYALFHQAKREYIDFFSLNNKFINYFYNEIAPNISNLEDPNTPPELDETIKIFSARHFGQFVSFFDNNLTKNRAAEKMIRDCLRYISTNGKSLLIDDITNLTSSRFIKSQSWNTLLFETPGFDYSNASWVEISTHYEEQGLTS